MLEFIPGLQLSELYYREAVKPILEAAFPRLVYSAALIGPGSEVLGYDTPQSMDHNWGPKVLLFVKADDYERYQQAIKEVLSRQLPYEIRGIPTNFDMPDSNGVQSLEKIDTGPVNHLVSVHTIQAYFEQALGVNPYQDIQTLAWLTIPEQKLLEVTAGKVFFDGLNELAQVRLKFSYYPHDIWLYLLASQWGRISQEEAFMGRCGDVGDELGSQLVAARMVRELMRLCFFMEKRYIPYTKWFGTAFSHLRSALDLAPLLREVLLAHNWKEREEYLSKAYERVAHLHNQLGITEPLATHVSHYYGRPYLVIYGERYVDAIMAQIQDPSVKSIAHAIGSINQLVDSTDVLTNPSLTKKWQALYLEE
jgi:Domain of unknown function (DUF4037)